VADGLDEVWIQCWECGASVKDLKVCAACSVARYCSRECQHKAWKSRRKFCPDQKEQFSCLLENFRIADATHAAGMVHGFYPNKEFDYGATAIFSALRSTWTMAAVGPSLEFMYKNIAHIARGDWWIYSAPDSFEQYKKKAASGTLLLHDGSSELLEIIMCLCYDLHGFVSKTTGGPVTTAAVEAALAPTLGTIDFGAKMPAEFFVASYGCHVDRRAGDPQTQGETATIAKAVLIKNLHQAELNGP